MPKRPIDPPDADLPDSDEPGSGGPDEQDEAGLTARPSSAGNPELEVDEDRVVPSSNVGGAAPSPGADSGGDLPGSEDDLANLAEPEPPSTPELRGSSVREEDLSRDPAPDED
jgi:hypothetical protein